jgi:phage shock protein C
MEITMKKLYRSRRDKMLFGLCGGISDLLNVDATLLRILLIVITVFTGGTAILVYVFAGIVVPKEPNYGGFGPSGFGGGWQGGFSQNHNHYGPASGTGGPYSYTPPQQPGTGPSHAGGWQQPPSASNLDAMMDDLEKKALRREIEELKAKLAKIEKGE